MATSLVAAGCEADTKDRSLLLGGLTVEIEESPARLRVLAPGGAVLLDGLAGSSLQAGAEPHVAAAFRRADEEWEMLFGSFKVEESAGDWAGLASLSDVTVERGSVSFSLLGERGARIGRGRIEEIGPSIVRVVLSAPGMDRATAAFACRPDERFIGLGAMTHDLDHRGRRVPIWVSEQGIGKRDDQAPGELWFVEGTRHQSYMPIPFFVSSEGYGVLLDSVRRTEFDFCATSEDVLRFEAWEGTLSFHLFHGPAPLDVIERHSSVVGRPSVPPPFTFAPWNDAVMGEGKVRGLAALLREHRIPSSVIWTEDWGGGRPVRDGEYQLYQHWSVDRSLYPDVEDMVDELNDAGFEFMGYFNSFLTKGNDHWQPAMDNEYAIQHPDGGPYLFQGVQFRPTTLVDLTNPAAVDWMAEALGGALDLGFAGWMADYGEWLPTDAILHSGEDARDVHNIYPILWQQLNARVMDERKGAGRDRLFFVRSGFTGSQGIPHMVVWAGDQTTDFLPDDGLPTVIPIGLGLGVAGFPYYGHDIAGYYTRPGSPVSKELFFRWTTLGALSPIMRTHHGRLVDANWTLERDEETLAHWARYARLHTRLYPYLLAAAHDAASRGAPIMRALPLAFPDDAHVWGLVDQFMLGPDLLIAPVVEESATSREVYFPAGRWVPLLGGAPVLPPSGGGDQPLMLPTQETVTGPVRRKVVAPLTEIPVYARAGSILALLPETIDTLAPAKPPVVSLATVADDRTVWAYLGAPGEIDEAESDLRYRLRSDAPPSSVDALLWNGVALRACDDLGSGETCARIEAAGREVSARVTGGGELEIVSAGEVVAALVSEGGAADRRLEIVLRW